MENTSAGFIKFQGYFLFCCVYHYLLLCVWKFDDFCYFTIKLHVRGEYSFSEISVLGGEEEPSYLEV